MVSIIFGESHTTMLSWWVLIRQPCINLRFPQGTILGLLSFLSYINDADNDINSTESCLNETIECVSLVKRKQTYEFMLIRSSQRLNTLAASPSVTMNGTRVKQVATTKSLGATIDDKLS